MADPSSVLAGTAGLLDVLCRGLVLIRGRHRGKDTELGVTFEVKNGNLVNLV